MVSNDLISQKRETQCYEYKLSSKRQERHICFGSGDTPFSVRYGSYRSIIILETVYLLKDNFTEKTWKTSNKIID